MADGSGQVVITLHGHELESVFDFLGVSENSITFSVGWALSRSPQLLEAISERIGAGAGAFNQVRLQDYGADGGYTDIELLGRSHHAIVEAKRGWWLPSTPQWERYTPRFQAENRPWRRFVAMSDCTTDYASLHLPKEHQGVGMSYFGWRDIEAVACKVGRTHSEKRLLSELAVYLRRVATMHDLRSNMVYVVSLGSYTLGPAMVPPHVVRNGNKIVRSNRVWAMIDLLLTSDTITDAMLEKRRRILQTDEVG